MNRNLSQSGAGVGGGKHSYTCVREVLRDLNLIWDNCMLYNTEGSEISGVANTLKARTTGLFEVF